jgi:hypothetical protein
MRDTIIEVLEFVGKCLQYPDLPSFAFGFLPKASAENIYSAQKLIRLASDDSVEFRVMELGILVENFDLDPGFIIQITPTIRRNIVSKYQDIVGPGCIICNRPELQSLRRILTICKIADSQPLNRLLRLAELAG